jgi:hypothetical protein
VVLVSLMLPWTGGVAGWRILAGLANFGRCRGCSRSPRCWFGVLGSAVALAGRHWAAAFVCRGRLRVLRGQRGVGDLVAASERPARRQRPGDRAGAGGVRDGGPDGLLGAHHGPPGLILGRDRRFVDECGRAESARSAAATSRAPARADPRAPRFRQNAR